MTTQQLVKMDIGQRQLPWDKFLRSEYRREGVLDEAIEPRIKAILLHIEPFRRNEWPAMCRALNEAEGIAWPQEVEPHWVAPSRAVLWQPTYVLETDAVTRRLTRKQTGWEPTYGLPAGNANQLARYLRKGFRIRPPLETVVEAPPLVNGGSVEAASSSLASGNKSGPPAAEEQVYICDRHATAVGRSGRLEIKTWRTYRSHCRQNTEPLQYEPPWSVKKSLRNAAFICPGCWTTFTGFKMAGDHQIRYGRRPDGAKHPLPSVMAEFANQMRLDLEDYESKSQPTGESNG